MVGTASSTLPNSAQKQPILKLHQKFHLVVLKLPWRCLKHVKCFEFNIHDFIFASRRLEKDGILHSVRRVQNPEYPNHNRNMQPLVILSNQPCTTIQNLDFFLPSIRSVPKHHSGALSTCWFWSRFSSKKSKAHCWQLVYMRLPCQQSWCSFLWEIIHINTCTEDCGQVLCLAMVSLWLLPSARVLVWITFLHATGPWAGICSGLSEARACMAAAARGEKSTARGEKSNKE